MDASRLFGELRTDIIGVLGQVLAELASAAASSGCCSGTLAASAHGILLARGRYRRRHQRLVHANRAADRAADSPSACWVSNASEAANQPRTHVPSSQDRNSGSRHGPEWERGVLALLRKRERTLVQKRRDTLPRQRRSRRIDLGDDHSGPSPPPSASTSPHGATIIEWPKVSRPSAWRPACAAEMTKAPFSIARARCKTCQWASPVWRVNAAGAVSTEAPACAWRDRGAESGCRSRSKRRASTTASQPRWPGRPDDRRRICASFRRSADRHRRDGSCRNAR